MTAYEFELMSMEGNLAGSDSVITALEAKLRRVIASHGLVGEQEQNALVSE